MRDKKKSAEILEIDTEKDHKILNIISANVSELEDLACTVQRVVVDVDNLTVKIGRLALVRYVGNILKLKIELPPEGQLFDLQIPYLTKRAFKGTTILRPDQKKKDMFDLPPQELRNLIRGFVWRDDHFKGETLEQIAARAGFSDAFVGRLIRSTFETTHARVQ